MADHVALENELEKELRAQANKLKRKRCEKQIKDLRMNLGEEAQSAQATQGRMPLAKRKVDECEGLRVFNYESKTGKLRRVPKHMSTSSTRLHCTTSSGSKGNAKDDQLDGDRHSKSFDDHADMEHVSGHDDIQHRPDCDDIMEEGKLVEVNLQQNLIKLKSMVSSTDSNKSWAKRMENRDEEWKKNRSLIFNSLMRANHLPHRMQACAHCLKGCGIFKCHQCGPGSLLCQECDGMIHSDWTMHDRKVWKDGFYQPISPCQTTSANQDEFIESGKSYPVTIPPICAACGGEHSLYKVLKNSTRIVITLQGRFDLNEVALKCKNCIAEYDVSSVETVLKEEYWPGNLARKVEHMFDEDLFLFYRLLINNNPGISLNGFVRTLEQFSSRKGRVDHINASVFSKAFKEWQYSVFSKLIIQKSSLFECPACFEKQHSVHIDGNKKLFRYSKVPRGISTQYYGHRFIAANEDVDSHLAAIGYTNDVEVTGGRCGTTRWKAAKANSTTMVNLDETGLEVAGCRHVIAQKAINMFKGEMYGYAHFIHNKHFMNVQYLWLDIICQYWPWALSKPGQTNTTTKPALSVMHSQAHSWSCQVLWSGRWQTGAAYGSGEDMEQLFSYLSRFNFTTKYMSASVIKAREEHLTEAAMFWNHQKVIRLPYQLKSRLLKAKSDLIEYKEELVKLKEVHNQELTDAVCMAFKNEVIQIAKREEQPFRVSDIESKMEDYYKLKYCTTAHPYIQQYLNSTDEIESSISEFIDLFKEAEKLSFDAQMGEDKLYCLRMEIRSKLGADKDIEKECKKQAIKHSLHCLEEEMEMLHISLLNAKAAVEKSSSTSKQRSKLRKAIASTKTKISKKAEEYNVLVAVAKDYIVKDCVSCDEVIGGEFPWTPLSGRRSVALHNKYRTAIVFNHIERLKEEIDLLISEMNNFIRYFMGVIQKLDDELAVLKLKISSANSTSGSSECNYSSPVTSLYEVSDESTDVLEGIVSVMEEGKFVARQHLMRALQEFQNLDCVPSELGNQSMFSYMDSLDSEDSD